MRINANPTLPPVSRSSSDLARLVSAESLSVARLEAVFTRREQGALGLDLIFVRDGEIAVIPAIRIAHEMLLEREWSPFIWPREAAALPESTLDAVEAQVLPWLEALAMTGNVNGEQVRRFSELLEARDFELAREAGFAGAATFRDAAAAISPYVYAQRFASGATVGITDVRGASGAALLARSAQRVQCDLGDSALNALAARWYGSAVSFAPVQEPCDIGIGRAGTRVELRFDEAGPCVVQVATPVPSEIVVSFDPEDAPPCRSFSVTCKERSALRNTVLAASDVPCGGSSGRIMLVHADVPMNQRGAEWDDRAELARRLAHEGFTIEMAPPSAAADPSRFDLIHAFDLGRDPAIARYLAEGRRHGIPIVATAGFAGDGGEFAWAGQVVNALMRVAQDETTLVQHLQMMALRRLAADRPTPAAHEAAAAYAGAVREALSCVDVLLACTAAEERFAREQCAYGGQIRSVIAYAAAAEPEPVDELAGTWDFVLAHTPIASNANLLMLSRAAQALDVPLVVAGPVADALYFAYLREAFDGRTVLLPHATPAQVSALYRRARVFADFSWSQPSLHRLVLAAAAGCNLAVAQTSPAAALWNSMVYTADPAAIGSVEQALAAAWAAPADPGLAAAAGRDGDPNRAFVETVRAYGAAQSLRAGVPA
ncbi:MAG TPA: hypothetical protein VFA29_00720 [Candidatus Baltobacteraceae bacterium]|nr:hypothetical protein [Candidatus Baltobacteraceae bacterium]